MRLTASLSFYDEPPGWLTAYVESLTLLGIEQLVAVDGAYALYPNGQPTSPPEQGEAIREACAGLRIRLDLHEPEEVWASESAKRQKLIDLADGDWLLVMDADELIVKTPIDFFHRLDATPHDAAECFLEEEPDPRWARGTIPGYQRARRLYRNAPGLHMGRAHHHYILDGMDLHDKTSPAETFHDLVIHHRLRDKERGDAARTYYRARDYVGTER